MNFLQEFDIAYILTAQGDAVLFWFKKLLTRTPCVDVVEKMEC